jgi:hypothetical protein
MSSSIEKKIKDIEEQILDLEYLSDFTTISLTLVEVKYKKIWKSIEKLPNGSFSLDFAVRKVLKEIRERIYED